jgi:hypothetical protein
VAWINSTDLQNKLKDILGKGAFASGSRWPTIADTAVAKAKAEIQAALLGRGYSSTQADGWDLGAAYHLDQATYWALVDGGAAQDGLDLALINAYDRTKALQTVTVLVGGVLVTLGAESPAAAVRGGRLTNTTDLFREPSAINNGCWW